MPHRSLGLLAFAALLAASIAAALTLSASAKPAPVRVVVTVRGGVALPSRSSAALLGRPTRAEQRTVQSAYASRAAKRAVAARVQGRRRMALRGLAAGIRQASGPMREVYLRVRALGGTVESTDRLAGVLTAQLPATAIPALRRDSRVAHIERAAPRLAPIANTAPAYAVGANTWWSAGYVGGSGAGSGGHPDGAGTIPNHGQRTFAKTDALPDLGLWDAEPIQEDHPDFANLHFEIPPGGPGNCIGSTWAPCSGHATAVLSMATGQGPSSCPAATGYTCNGADIDPTIKGSAPLIDKVLDPMGATLSSPSDGFSGMTWAEGITQTGWANGTLAGASDPMEVFNESMSSGPASADDSSSLQLEDVPAMLGILRVYGAGNDGPNPGTVSDPSISYDGLSVGAVDPSSNATDPSDDVIAGYSSRGPSPAGRKKPDLVAIGNSYPLARYDWRSSGSLWRSWTGTSLSSPQVAGAALLLEGYGITDPLAVKSVLIDSARAGRATSASAMGTQTTWNADWGWGELDLTAAYNQRDNFDVDSAAANDVRYFAATTQAGGDRATIAWNRRVAADQSNVRNYNVVTPYPLTDLNLYEYAQGSSTPEASSTSAIDNVEQVRSPGAGAVIYKVTSGGVSAASSEPYAIAATQQLTPLTTPRPQITVSSDRTTLGLSDTANLTVTVSNPSSQLDASGFATSVTPANGVQISESGSDAPPPSTLAAGASYVEHYTVHGNVTGASTVNVTTKGTAYGSTLGRSVSQAYNVDLTGPTASISAPSSASGTFTVSWSASDPSGVSGYEVQAATDGGSWAGWSSGTTTSGDYPGQPGHSYRFRVRATDGLGNTGGWAESGTVTVPAPSPPPSNPITAPVTPVTPAQPTTLTKASAALRISKATIDSHHVLTVQGSISNRATGSLRVSVTIRGSRSMTATIKPKAGRFTIRMRLGSKYRNATKVTVSYQGDRRLLASSAPRSLTAARRSAQSKTHRRR